MMNVTVPNYDKVDIVVKTRQQVVWSSATGRSGSEMQANEHQYPLASTQSMALSENRAKVIDSGYRTYGNSGVHSFRAPESSGN
jgi:hypothetical protein